MHIYKTMYKYGVMQETQIMFKNPYRENGRFVLIQNCLHEYI